VSYAHVCEHHVSIRSKGRRRPCCPPAEPCPSSQATAAPVRPTTAANTTRRPRDSSRVLIHRRRGQRSRVSHSWCVPRFILQRCHHTHDHHQPSCPWPLLDGVDRRQTLGRGRSTTPPLARSCAPLLADCCAASILTTASIPTTASIVRRGHCNDGTRCKPEQARLRRAGYNTMHAACDRFGALPGGVGVRRVGGLEPVYPHCSMLTRSSTRRVCPRLLCLFLMLRAYTSRNTKRAHAAIGCLCPTLHHVSAFRLCHASPPASPTPLVAQGSLI
jgi:hypothetical protein